MSYLHGVCWITDKFFQFAISSAHPLLKHARAAECSMILLIYVLVFSPVYIQPWGANNVGASRACSIKHKQKQNPDLRKQHTGWGRAWKPRRRRIAPSRGSFFPPRQVAAKEDTTGVNEARSAETRSERTEAFHPCHPFLSAHGLLFASTPPKRCHVVLCIGEHGAWHALLCRAHSTAVCTVVKRKIYATKWQ